MFKKKIEEIISMESNIHLPYLFLGSEAYLIDDTSISSLSSSSSLQIHKPINKDMISDLPDNILHHILSFLSTKTAITTIILSKRWRYLWTHYYSKNHNSSYSYSLLDVLSTLLDKSKHHLVEKKRLNILIPRVILDEHTITSLVTSLLGLKVQHLEFIILDTRYLNTRCVLPSGFSASNSLSKLTLKVGGYTLYIPTGIQFPGLKTLNLYYATFANEEAVEEFFCGCPVLEELSLNYCYWLYIEQITIAIPTLRILSIRFDPHCLNCDDFDKISVKIDVVNLLSLTCISDPSIKFVIVNPLTSMVDAYISFSSHFQLYAKEYSKYAKYLSQCAVALLSGLASVKSLALSRDTIKEPRYENNHFHLLSEFNNLTHLSLGIDSNFARKTFTQILLRCPKLKVLVFPLGIYTFTDNHDWKLIPLPGCFKSSLKKLHISRFDGSEWEIQFVEFFLENATVLEEFQISLSCWSYSRYNLKNLADLKNRFVGMGSCVIKFRSAKLVEKDDALWKRHYGI